MSTIFQGDMTGLGSTIEEAKIKAAKAAQVLKDKKEETGTTIEEGLASLKVMMGGKGVTKAIVDDPIVKKFAGQLKQKGIDAVKDFAKRGVSKVEDTLAQATRGGVGANPTTAATTATSESTVAESTIAETGFPTTSSAFLQQSEEGVSATAAEISDASAAAKAGEETATVGRGLVGSEMETAFPTTGLAETGSAATSAGAAADATVPEAFTLDTSAAGTAAYGAGAAGDAAGAAAGAGAAGAAGGEAAVGGTEAVLAGLDAIPGLDIFTLIAGAALGIGAGVGAAERAKHPQQPVMPPASQNHVAFVAGLQNV